MCYYLLNLLDLASSWETRKKNHSICAMIFSNNLKNHNELNGYNGTIIMSTCQVLWMTIVDERIGIS